MQKTDSMRLFFGWFRSSLSKHGALKHLQVTTALDLQSTPFKHDAMPGAEPFFNSPGDSQ